jgi:hypothetical protein
VSGYSTPKLTRVDAAACVAIVEPRDKELWVARRSRIASSLVAGALPGSVPQTPAFASAPSSGDDGPGIIGTVKGSFGGGHSAPKPPIGPKDATADRQKLPPGGKAPFRQV